MKMTREIWQWLQENAYASKEGDYWRLSDFPPNQIPDYLAIPITKSVWRKIKELIKE